MAFNECKTNGKCGISCRLCQYKKFKQRLAEERTEARQARIRSLKEKTDVVKAKAELRMAKNKLRDARKRPTTKRKSTSTTAKTLKKVLSSKPTKKKAKTARKRVAKKTTTKKRKTTRRLSIAERERRAELREARLEARRPRRMPDFY
jgi:hypothetical protein